MTARLRAFLQRHPLVRDAILWAIPAILFGAILRGMMLSYLPYAYWGSDSRSYYSFAELLLDEGKISLYDKRRYLYPIFLLPVSLLPGAPLKWVAWIQHAAGLATLVPLAYCVRKIFVGWKLWIVPITVLIAGMPIMLWYEHELLAEALFFHAFIWMFAGWFAFASARESARAAQLFWWFFGGLAAVILLKPAGRFLWPAVALMLVAVAAWRLLKPRHWIALAALLGLTFTIGQDTQGAWLLYTSAFPLTQLETPLHAEYKAEIAPMVRKARALVTTSDRGPDSKDWKKFLKWPENQSERPLWQKLGEDDRKKQRVYKDLAFEGIKADPLLFLRIALGKIIASANPGEFRSDRFLPSYTIEKYENQYRKGVEKNPERVRRIFALPRDFVFPPYEEFSTRLAPHPDSAAAAWLHAYAGKYHAASRMVVSDDEDDPSVVLTPLARWLLLGCALAFLPWHWRTAGFGVVLGASYLFGVFLVGGINPRYFGAVWGIVAIALAIPLDLAARFIAGRFRSS